MNPVLPPPRPVHVDNPVEVLLTARNPEQVRRHFARLRQARLYGWTQDTNYKGSKGGKWVGTDEDAGKVRYQANKPGAGRGGKKESSGEKKGSGGGEKPWQTPKEAYADIVQHLRDVLSGEGEEADALFAKLQDRLQGMSPSERKEAAAKLEAVLGGKPTKEKAPAKRATKQPAEKKPAAGKQASEADTFEATKQAWSELTKEGNVNIPELYDAVAEQIPGLTLPEFHKMLLQWKADDLITLQLNGHRDAFPRSSEGIEGQKGLYFFVQLRDDPANLKLPAGRDKPAQPAKEAPAKTPAKRQPAAAKKKPQKGDVNEKGQVYDGRWWRRPEGEKPAPKPRAKKAAAEKQPAEKPAEKPGKIADKPTPAEIGVPPSAVPGSPVHEPPRLPEPPTPTQQAPQVQPQQKSNPKLDEADNAAWGVASGKSARPANSPSIRIVGAKNSYNAKGRGSTMARRVFSGGQWKWVSKPASKGRFLSGDRNDTQRGDVYAGDIVAEYTLGGSNVPSSVYMVVDGDDGNLVELNVKRTAGGWVLAHPDDPDGDKITIPDGYWR